MTTSRSAHAHQKGDPPISTPQSRRPHSCLRTGASGILLALTLIVAGCGPTSPAPYDLSSPAATSAPPGPGGTTAAGSVAPTSTAGHTAPELEAALPRALDGLVLAMASGTGPDVLRDDPWSRQMARSLLEMGRTTADLRYAQAWDPTGRYTFDLAAFRVPGIDGARLQAAIIDGIRAGTPDVSVTPSTLGGKGVTAVVYPADPATTYLVERDGTVIDVATTDADLAARLLAAVP